jgi:TonB family protein
MLFVLLAAAAEPATLPALAANPDWEQLPSPQQFSSLYPREAMRDGVGGRVMIACTVETDGRLSGCRIEDEDPEGYRFGAAALRMAGYFKMRPKTEAGRPVGGGTVFIPIRFRPPPVFVEVPEGWEALQAWGAWEKRYPSKAKEAGLKGEATIECVRSKSRRRAICNLLSETPEGYGFGGAALAMSGDIAVRRTGPAAVDEPGVRMTIRFQPPR